jgi:hypothetical protein
MVHRLLTCAMVLQSAAIASAASKAQPPQGYIEPESPPVRREFRAFKNVVKPVRWERRVVLDDSIQKTEASTNALFPHVLPTKKASLAEVVSNATHVADDSSDPDAITNAGSNASYADNDQAPAPAILADTRSLLSPRRETGCPTSIQDWVKKNKGKSISFQRSSNMGYGHDYTYTIYFGSWIKQKDMKWNGGDYKLGGSPSYSGMTERFGQSRAAMAENSSAMTENSRSPWYSGMKKLFGLSSAEMTENASAMTEYGHGCTRQANVTYSFGDGSLRIISGNETSTCRYLFKVNIPKTDAVCTPSPTYAGANDVSNEVSDEGAND